MARTPSGDRSDRSKPDHERPDDADQRSTPGAETTPGGGGQPQQRRNGHERYFAPGEDGECH